MRIGSAYSVIIQWADAEFRRRNGRPSPLAENVTRDGWTFGAGDGGEYDVFHREEAQALMEAASQYYNQVKAGTQRQRGPWGSGNAASGSPAPTVFQLIPSSSRAREKWKAVPWWRRILEDAPAASPLGKVPINVLDIQAIRDINNQLRALGDGPPASTAPVNTEADLAALVAQATPVTQRQMLRRQQIGMTVSGGGGLDGRGGLGPGGATGIANDMLREQLTEMAFDVIRPNPFTPQQSLAIAIGQLNYLYANGGSKSLIRHWQEEIAQANFLIRRMP